MPKIIIDNKELDVENGSTVMHACKKAGIEIPHFCYHERLNIAGNCRMCLVEMERSPKPIASCAMPVSDGMVIKTDTPMVKKAREGVMEFLLANHPLDCPICDQGGECDLQDQAFKYGNRKSRYTDNKRAVKDKNLGPLVKTHMTRCIHCTRCIRFATEIAGVEEIGAVGRGEHMEITSYLEKTLNSELSGNIIDLCPVGALTSKPYAFHARSWELKKTSSIDVMDAMGSNIRIDSRNDEVMRILPKLNEDINEEWLSDKARFSYDGLKSQRLDKAYIKKNGKFIASKFDEAITFAARGISSVKPTEIAAIAGTSVNVESMFCLKKLLQNIGSSKFDANQFGYKFDVSARSNYLFNTKISDIDKSDACLLIGSNIRHAAPLLNAKIGQRVRAKEMSIARIGPSSDQTYNIEELGDNVSLLQDILDGKNNFAKKLANADKPMVILGKSALVRDDAHAILALTHQIIKKYKIIRSNWNGFNILHDHASSVGALDIGFYYGNNGDGCQKILEESRNNKVKVLYLLASDDIDMSKIGKDCFVIYQGHHGDAGAKIADVILPEAAYTEQDGIFVNMEGRPQCARAAISPPGIAAPSWKIISSLSKRLKKPLAAENLLDIRKILVKENAVFGKINQVISDDLIEFKSVTKLQPDPIKKDDSNYYMTDPISRASVTMAKCRKATEKISEAV